MDAPEDGRSARKRKAIMAAATQVFLAKGYLGTTIDEIAALAAVSKQTVYKNFTDKEQLFAEIVLATTDEIDDLVRLVSASLDGTAALERDLGSLAREFMTALMRPHLLRLRRLVIANADRLPHLGRAWYERGFARVLATLAARFQALAAAGRLKADDPMLAAQHFVGLLLWIPINKAMFSGDDEGSSTPAELERTADAAVRAFLGAYGGVGTSR